MCTCVCARTRACVPAASEAPILAHCPQATRGGKSEASAHVVIRMTRRLTRVAGAVLALVYPGAIVHKLYLMSREDKGLAEPARLMKYGHFYTGQTLVFFGSGKLQPQRGRGRPKALTPTSA